MKTLTVRLPDALALQIEVESRRRKVSKSDVVRERLAQKDKSRSKGAASLDAIADLIGAIDALPRDLGAKAKDYLRSTGYGRKRPR